jgi:hypothetical protein
MIWIALTGRILFRFMTEGVALGWDGSGRWPDDLDPQRFF